MRARGVLQVLPAGGEQTYREAASRHVLSPAGDAIDVAAERRPRIGLEAGTVATSMLIAAAAFSAVTWIGGGKASCLARSAASEVDGDVAVARRALRWGQLGAATPFNRTTSLAAIDNALDGADIRFPERQRELVFLVASYERYRTGGCRRVLDLVAWRASPRFTIELGEACGGADSLRVVTEAWIQLGELARASDAAARAARLDRARRIEEVELEQAAHLLAGRFALAAAATRELQARVDELDRGPPEPGQAARRSALRTQLGCAADQLSARIGDGAARARLEAAMAGAASGSRARWVCGALLADLTDGTERLAFTDRLREDPTAADRSDLEVLELLDLEVDPARAKRDDPLSHVTEVEQILAGELGVNVRTPLRWRALDRLAALAGASPAARRKRAALAGQVAVAASMIGDDAAALRWSDLRDRDVDSLRAELERDSFPEVLRERRDWVALQRAHVELRAGRTPDGLPPRAAGEAPDNPYLISYLRELDGVLDFVEQGTLDRLRGANGDTLVVRAGEPYGVFAGLELVARGGGPAFARWLGEADDDVGFAVALLGARWIRTGRRDVLAWLQRTETARPDRTLAELATRAANRQKIAEALGDRAAAARHGAAAERLRRGLLRRDTAMVRLLLHIR